MATTPMNQTNLANYIPTIWAKEVQSAVEEALVCGKVVDRSYERYAAGGGGTVVVPVLSNLSVTAYNATADISYSTTNETAVNITLNQRYYVAFGVDPFTQIQDAIGYFEKAKTKVSYALAEQIDTSLGTLFASFGNSTGTEGTAVGVDQLIAAYESINENNAPHEGRAWIFDPETVTDLMGLDYFVKMDYVPDSVSKNGFQGRQIFGAPVYMTTNLPAVNTSYHAAAYLHREAIALVIQGAPKLKLAFDTRRASDVVIGTALWGVKEMRDGFGVWIKTRS